MSPMSDRVGHDHVRSGSRTHEQGMVNEKAGVARSTIKHAPTPTRTRPRTIHPTPETVRQPRKSTTSASTMEADKALQTQRLTGIPTPQTQPRVSKRAVAQIEPRYRFEEDQDAESDTDSPEGHTTFSHIRAQGSAESSVTTRSGSTSVRRRPGLTFAQQMGLVAGLGPGVTAGPAMGPGLSVKGLGAGIGMGGHRTISHAVDRIGTSTLSSRGNTVHTGADERNPIVVGSAPVDDNPFLVSPFEAQRISPLFASCNSSPADELAQGRRDGGDIKTNTITTPPGVSMRLMPPPAEPTSPTTCRIAASANRVMARERGAHAAALARRRQIEAKRKEMMDEDNNPFLLKPGESVRPKDVATRATADDAHRPFVTYVFRGTKRIFANPFIPANTRLANAELHPAHEDFDEHPCPKPRLLWPSAPVPSDTSSTPSSGRAFEEEFTPSPPSSPILQTPQTRPRAAVKEAVAGETPAQDRSETGASKRKAPAGNFQSGRRVKVNRRL